MSGASTAPSPASAGDLGAEVRRLIASCMPSCRPEELADDTPLLEGGVGLDSVRLVELLYACEDRFGVQLSTAFLEAETPSVGALIRLIAEAADAGSGEN